MNAAPITSECLILVLRYTILTCAGIGILAGVVWMRRHSRQRWMLAAPMTVVIHVALFHSVRVLSLPLSIPTLNLWSAFIHLHILLLVIIGLYLFWRYDND